MGVTDTDQQLIDVHAHFLTDAYVSAARAAGHIHPDGMAGWPTWSAEEHLRLMDRWRVATAMLSISSPGTHFGDDAAARRLTREVNEAGASISRAYPGRFGHFASLPLPDVPGALDELGYALDDLDSDGITIETNSAGMYLGDDRYEAVPRQLRRLWFDIAGTPFPNQVPAVVAAFGTGRLLYGSDYCWTPADGVDAQLGSIDEADQPANDSWRTTRNANRLLRRDR